MLNVFWKYAQRNQSVQKMRPLSKKRLNEKRYPAVKVMFVVSISLLKQTAQIGSDRMLMESDSYQWSINLILCGHVKSL